MIKWFAVSVNRWPFLKCNCTLNREGIELVEWDDYRGLWVVTEGNADGAPIVDRAPAVYTFTERESLRLG